MISNGHNAPLNSLPKFQGLTIPDVYCINRITDLTLLENLIDIASRTNRYTITTTADSYMHAPAVLQIEFIRQQSIVLLIETCYLPDTSSISFTLIRSLLENVFHTKNLIFSWGNLYKQLFYVYPTQVFSLNLLQHMNYVDIQDRFKIWCLRTFSCDDLYICIQNATIRSYASIINQGESRKWSLQMAIAFAFDEYLDQNLATSHWNDPVGVRLAYEYMIEQQSNEYRLQRIQCVVNKCLAITKLVRVFGFSHKPQQENRNFFL